MTLMLIFVLTTVIALLAQWQVRRMYRRVPAASGYTRAGCWPRPRALRWPHRRLS